MNRCAVCEGVDFEEALTAYDRMVARVGAFLYRRCLACGLLSLFPTPTQEELEGFYPEDYAPHGTKAADDRRRRDRSPWNRLALRTLYRPDWQRGSSLRKFVEPVGGWVMRDLMLPRGDNRLLDVGCGAGALLARHRALGWDVRGVEPSARGAAACRAAGLRVEECDLRAAELPEEHFDVVLLKHVVEHVPEPRVALARARDLLAPNGLLVVVTPNTAGIGLRVYGNCWYALDAPRHLHLFNARNLWRLAVAVGLRTEAIAAEGSTRVVAQSRMYARTQGDRFPDSLVARCELVEQTANPERGDAAFRRLASPGVALLAAFGVGDTLRARFVRESV